MCYSIPANVILANLLYYHKEYTVDACLLNNIRELIYSDLKNEIFYLDTTDDSICFAVESNPNLFAWKENKVARAKDSEKFYVEKYIMEYVNREIPRKFLNVIEKTVKEEIRCE